MTPISSFWDTVLDFWLSPGSWNSFKAVQSLLGDGKWEIHSVYWKQSSPLNLLLLWPFTNSFQEHKYGVHIWSGQNRDCFGPDQDWNYGGWGEGRNKAITPPDLMLNQWHFKGNQGGSCQPVFMSCSEIEAPQWRSLCWKQRCEHFSISLLLLFGVSFTPNILFCPHLFSTANAVCRSPSATAHSGSRGAPWAPEGAGTPRGSWGTALSAPALHAHRGHVQSIYFLWLEAKLAPVTTKTCQSNEKNEKGKKNLTKI